MATAPACPRASLANPMAIGKIVPPKSPMIIRPDTSFFLSGCASNACEKRMGKIFELPNPINAMQIYRICVECDTNKPAMAAPINTVLTAKKVFQKIQL